MNSEQLHYFQTTARVSHMSKAAEMLNISQPALSANIRKLEFEIGVPLFDRVGRNIVLNAYGKEFLACVDSITNDMNRCIEHIRSMHKAESNTVTIRMPSLSNYPNLLHRIYEKHPDVNLNNKDCLFSELNARLMNGQLEFCVIGKIPEPTELTVKKVVDTVMVVLVSENSPYAKLETASMETFKDDEFCDFPSDFASGASPLKEVCKDAGFAVKIGFTGNTLYDLLDAVRHRHFIARLPRYILKNFNMDGIHEIELEPPANNGPLYMMWSKEILATRPLANDVRLIIEEYFEECFQNAQFE